MAEPSNKEEQPLEKPLEKMTVKDLREIAMGIPHSTAIHDMKKDELLAFIREAKGIRDETPARRGKKAVKLKLTPSELKAKIREMKGMRQQALEAKETKKAQALRRRIGGLKKLSRRAAGG